MSGLVFYTILSCANSEDPDQTPHLVTCDLDLHCLPTSLLWDTGHYWVSIQNLAVVLLLRFAFLFSNNGYATKLEMLNSRTVP